MKRWLKILLVLTLVLVCRESDGLVYRTVTGAEQAGGNGEITEKDSDSRKDTQLRDFLICSQGYEYTAQANFPQTARIRSGGVRRCPGSTKVFVKSRQVINTSNHIGFTPEQSRFVSGTLSAAAHFILLRKLRI